MRVELREALRLAAAGLHIAPVTIHRGDGGKKVADNHGVTWSSAASVDPGMITYWAQMYPGCSFLVNCAMSGLEVVDLDVKGGGPAWWESQGLPMTGALTVSTASGGLHLYWRAREDGRSIGTTVGAVAAGVDSRAAGGCTFAPGASVVGEPGRYEILGLGPGDLIPHVSTWSVVPDEVVERFEPAGKARRSSGEDNPVHDRAWMLAQWADQVARVESWRVGDQPDFRSVLLGAALLGGRAAGAGTIDEDEVTAALEGACAAVWGSPDERDRRWIADGLADGLADPWIERWEFAQAEHGEGGQQGEGAAYGHELGDNPASLRWLLGELGQRGLAGIFRRGGQVVYTPRVGEAGYVPAKRAGEDDGPAQVQPMSSDLLVARLPLAGYVVVKTVRGEYKRELFPDHVARKVVAVAAAGDDAPHLRVLRGVTHTPVVRKDGSILTEPGYDEATGLLYLPTVEVPPVDPEPSLEEVGMARDFLLDIVDGFPFVTVHDQANWLGVLLLPLLRDLLPPPYRLVVFGAHQPASGKTMLSELILIVHGGVKRGPPPADGAELGKMITGVLTRTTAPMVRMDNCVGTLRSERLAALLTASRLSDRVLGSTNETEMINDRVWMITANNAVLGGDLVRRAMWITIDPKQPNPELRTFARDDLEAHVKAHRAEILWALLTLVRYWVNAGMPTEPRPSSDQYGEATAVLRGILSLAGVEGEFDDPSTRLQSIGEDDQEWGNFLAAVQSVFGDRTWTARELLGKVEMLGSVGVACPAGRIPLDALPGELADKIGRAGAARSLGKWLGYREGRWAERLTVRPAGKDRTGTILWRVEEAAGE